MSLSDEQIALLTSMIFTFVQDLYDRAPKVDNDLHSKQFIDAFKQRFHICLVESKIEEIKLDRARFTISVEMEDRSIDRN